MGLFQHLFGGGQTEDLKTIITQGAYLVDVREPNEFANGTAKGAVNIPLGTIVAQLAKFKNKKNIIVFCRSGNRSRQAKIILAQNGIQDVINGGTWENVSRFVH